MCVVRDVVTIRVIDRVSRGVVIVMVILHINFALTIGY